MMSRNGQVLSWNHSTGASLTRTPVRPFCLGKESYVQGTFLSFVTVQVRGGRSNEVGSAFYSFFGKLCPNPQMMWIEDVNFYERVEKVVTRSTNGFSSRACDRSSTLGHPRSPSFLLQRA